MSDLDDLVPGTLSHPRPSVAIHIAGIDEASLIGVQITEYPPMPLAEIRDKYHRRLHNRDHLILMGSYEGVRCGYIVGYATGEREYYLWLCGVLEAFRGRGVASGLLAAFEERVRTAGYDALSVRTGNAYPAMMRLLLRGRYVVSDLEKGSHVGSHVVCMSKPLGDAAASHGT